MSLLIYRGNTLIELSTYKITTQFTLVFTIPINKNMGGKSKSSDERIFSILDI